MVLNALQAVLMVIVIMAFGFFAGWRGWATKSVTVFISKLIVNITLPCAAIIVFTENFTSDTLGESFVYIGISVLAILLSYTIAKIVAAVAKIPKTKRGVFVSLFAFSNSMFIGFPVALAIFGEKGIIFAMFYYVANSVTMNSIGFVEIANDGMEIARLENSEKPASKITIGRIFRQVLQPPLLAIIVGIVFVLLNVQLPDFLRNAVDYTGQITSPLALIFVGIILQRTGLSCIRRINKEISLSLIGRFVVSPALMLLVVSLAGFSSFATQVLVVQVGLPAMVSTTIFAESSGADTELAAQGVVITTLVSFITIPIYIAMFGA